MSKNITTQEIELLKKHGTLVTYYTGRTIYFIGEPADRMYFIIQGRVRMFLTSMSGKEVNIDVVEAGNVFGESIFDENGLRPVNVQAVTKTVVISCTVSQIYHVFAEDPGFSMRMLCFCSERMNRLSKRINDQCVLDRFGKVAEFILDITADNSKDRGTDNGRVPYTHEELAAALGLSRPTISLILKKFQDRGWVEKNYRHLIITDREALIDFVEEQNND